MRMFALMIRSRTPGHGLGRTVCVVLLAVLTAIAACSSHKAVSHPTPTQRVATTQPTATTLPAFSDWRVAYLDASANLHAVSTDGNTDVVGPTLPGFTTTGFNLPASGVSPNGRLLAYTSDTTLIANLTGGSPAVTNVPGTGGSSSLAWSPDGSLLAVSNNLTMPLVVRSSDLQTRQILTPPAYQTARIGPVYGWLNATHIVVEVGPRPDPSTPSSSHIVLLASVDIISGEIHVIATLGSPFHGTAYFSLSPDGRQALYYDRQFRDVPYVPEIDLIDTASGQITPLPGIVRAMGANYYGFSDLAWRPGTDTIAASTGFNENSDLRTWMLDLTHDSATPLTVTGYPVAWAPNDGPLLLSSDFESVIGGRYTIQAATCDASGQCGIKTLTTVAYHYNFLGLVRTA